jgi:hypothetical protein
MAKGEAKGKIVPIRFNIEELKRVTTATKANKQTISEWVEPLCKASHLNRRECTKRGPIISDPASCATTVLVTDPDDYD